MDTGHEKIIFIEQVSAMIGKTLTTIRNCNGNQQLKHLIPQPFRMPNSRRLCWRLSEVESWINSVAEPHLPRKRRGRPTKKEAIKTAAE
ncbi:MAG: hypothetical protein LBS40_00325 [Burkholderiales bacterium]|jgi:predicted DNA-binding transcriptional regulator AlpA|nr:hypothetical protein [Burkholderiales bacterium]